MAEGLPPRLQQALDVAGVPYEVLRHEATLHRAEDGAAHFGIALAQMAPTLIVQTEAGPLAATISGTTRLSLRKVKRALGLRNVALAPRELVVDLTGAEPGVVALINPGIATVVDRRLLDEPWAYGGCGIPARTLRMRPADVVAVTGARVLDVADPKTPEGRA